MFFPREQAVQERAKGIREANRALRNTLNKDFTEQYQSMREEAIEAGVSPEKVDEFLQKVKQDTQIELLRRFKEMLQQITKESHITVALPQLDIDPRY